nr:uncharacterized protein LOC120969798 [Aegilops tauschii subsp. strangulata]
MASALPLPPPIIRRDQRGREIERAAQAAAMAMAHQIRHGRRGLLRTGGWSSIPTTASSAPGVHQLGPLFHYNAPAKEVLPPCASSLLGRRHGAPTPQPWKVHHRTYRDAAPPLPRPWCRRHEPRLEKVLARMHLLMWSHIGETACRDSISYCRMSSLNQR